MKAIYLPVVDNLKEYSFWTTNSQYFIYPYVLVSPYTTNFINREKFVGNKEVENLKIYADSGGYQVATGSKKISAIDILRWQESIADVAFTLDIPPFSYNSDLEFSSARVKYTKNYFEKCLKKSVENAELMYKMKEREDMKLYAVLQGKNIDELMRWYKEITKNYDFDGYCISFSAVTRFCSWRDWVTLFEATKLIDKDIHYLGRSDNLTLTVLAKLSKITKHIYTYDSSSTTAVISKAGKYYDPYNNTIISLSKYEDRRAKIIELPCSCPVCSKHNLEELINNSYLRLLHSIYCHISYNKYVNVMVNDDDFFEMLLEKSIEKMNISNSEKDNIKKTILSIVYDENKSNHLSKYF